MKILLLAGEESGLLYASRLKELIPAEYRGYQDFFRTSDLAVMGFFPVLRRLFFFLHVAATMKALIRNWKPDVVVTVDYPGLNLKLAAYAKARGIPAVHLVCPQVWAWRRGRIPKIEAALTKLLCFFPFEPSLFPPAPGFRAVFIGHPLVDLFADDAAGKTVTDGKRIALLPGSRTGEIQRILPRLLQTAALLPTGFRFEIPAANARATAEIEKILALPAFTAIRPSVTVLNGGARALLRHAAAAVVASGTATLEAALARCPTVLVYAVSPLFAWLARHLITGVRHVGLANIIAEKSAGGTVTPPMPELLQEDFTPEAAAAILTPWLTDAAARATAVASLDAAMACLKSDGEAFETAAREIVSSVQDR